MRFSYDIRSFLIVFSVLLGNAAIFDIDIFLACIAPTMFVLWAGLHKNATSQNVIMGLSLAIVILSLLQMRAFVLEFPFTELYWYWPIKCIILLLFFIILPQVRWPMGNQIALGLFCILLIASAEIENGRMVSIFGPNMLYRFFGAFYLIAIFQLRTTVGAARKWQYASIALSIAAILATGSSGGLVVLAFPLIFLLTPTRFLGFAAMLTILVFLSGQEQVVEITAIARLVSKLQTIDDSTRVVGTLALISEPFSFIGKSYQNFTHVWSFGYQYPHNMLIELYVYFGVIGILTAFLICLGAAISFKDNPILFGLMAVFIGAMLSGDLSENFGPIAIYLGCLVHRFT